MCEEFKCLPWQAEEQLEHDPQMVFDVFEVREFARVKHAIDHAKSEADVPRGPMADLVAELMFDALQERKSE
jgi:hypothetical protein